jgi:hypothetical protein
VHYHEAKQDAFLELDNISQHGKQISALSATKKRMNHHICVTVSVSKVEPTAKFTRTVIAFMKKV